MTVSFPDVVEPDPDRRAAAAARRVTLPAVDALLGRLAGATDWLTACQEREAPVPLKRVRMVVIAGDHGNGTAALSDSNPLAGSAARTRSLLDSIADGSAPIALLAEVNEVGIRIAEVATGSEEPQDHDPSVEPHRVRFGHPVGADADALSHEEYERAAAVGSALADAEVDAGADLLIPALAGSGHEVPVTLLAAAITGMEPVDAVGFAAEVDPAAWSELVAAVRDGLFRARRDGGDTTSLLRIGGGADLTALTTFCAQAAVRRTPVILDGVAALVAGVLANRFAPGANEYFVAAQESTSRLGRRLQELLGLTSVTALEVTAENGAAAVQAVGLLNNGLRLLG
ncbi:nicotinate-nucleotide--dimethylbenzimidazole phosphoribosyltransferase [Nakamurella silvestris]|nr:nicotinate-nucleotide--dimethylbenzimidazole phosphoribosyltransferase [Nakamurella silvestris]